MRGISLNPNQKSTQDLSVAPLSYTAIYGKRFKLDQVLVDFNQPVSESITITVIDTSDPSYNHVLQNVILSAETSFDWHPQGEANFQESDNILVQCTNANGVGIAKLTIKSSQLGSGG